MNSADKELSDSILAGEMKNAWQVEDRPNQPDLRPAERRNGSWNIRSARFYENFDRIFGGKKNGPEEKEKGGSFDHSQEA